jgi:hypothetical protein
MVRQDLDLVRADPVALLLLAAAQGCRLCHLQRVRGLAERRVTPVCPPHPIQIGADSQARGTSSSCGSISRFHLSSGRSLSRSGRDDRVRPLRGPAAVGADRSQAAGPDLPSQRRIRRLEAQSLKLVEQGDAPQMRILDQPRRDVVEERRGRVDGTLTRPRFPLAVQVVPDRLAVPATWRAIAVIVQPCRRSAWISTLSSRVIMSTGSPSNRWCVVRDHQRRRRPAPRGGATPAGNFGERQWGISVSAITLPSPAPGTTDRCREDSSPGRPRLRSAKGQSREAGVASRRIDWSTW